MSSEPEGMESNHESLAAAQGARPCVQHSIAAPLCPNPVLPRPGRCRAERAAWLREQTWYVCRGVDGALSSLSHVPPDLWSSILQHILERS